MRLISMVSQLRRVLVLLLLAVAPVLNTGPGVTLVTFNDSMACGASNSCDDVELQARMHREVEDRTRIFWTGSGIVLIAVVGGLTWLVRHPRTARQ
ncbi:hypothetical protein [Actinoplanes couchii]|uniref:Transmembrane protein n=1 Tax=Actinoplanes couchii TaxID=403638 RepID=A0ABQ3XK06_9ACTN|nr:hypothetical protein [Actinoplanes couchii]MDR6324322.1 hypothetical protein [Actinoplanes couchii]GID58832.1 hypothetical protein Aco03nite_072360 [Actinoplanes couchii]